MRVLVIAEDPTHDHYILKPVVEKLLEDAGRPSAAVEVLRDPALRGADQALRREVVAEIIEDNRPMIDLFLLIVDRDCDRQRHGARLAERLAEHEGVLLGCAAVEEVETWMLALHRAELEAAFGEVRAECDPKERFAEPFLSRMGWSTEVGGGRKRAMRALAGNWAGLLQVCPEIRGLRDALREWLVTRG
jgi:hypothetical protein